jgi:hypothetical protein
MRLRVGYEISKIRRFALDALPFFFQTRLGRVDIRRKYSESLCQVTHSAENSQSFYLLELLNRGAKFLPLDCSMGRFLIRSCRVSQVGMRTVAVIRIYVLWKLRMLAEALRASIAGDLDRRGAKASRCWYAAWEQREPILFNDSVPLCEMENFILCSFLRQWCCSYCDKGHRANGNMWR